MGSQKALAGRSGLSRLFRSPGEGALNFHRRAKGRMGAKPTYEKVLNF